MIKKYLSFFFIVCIVCCSCAAGAVHPVIRIDSIPQELNLDTCWAFHAGDDMQWASPLYNDSGWDTVFTDLGSTHAHKDFKGIGWFRIRLKIAPSLFHKTVVFKMRQEGASEVYFNGNRIFRFGTIAKTRAGEVPFNPANNPYFIQFGADTIQVMAVRYSAFTSLAKKRDSPGFIIALRNTGMLIYDRPQREGMMMGSVFLFAMFFAFGIFHLLLFFFHRKIRSNLYYSIMAIILSLFWLYPTILIKSDNPFITSILNDTLLYVYAPFFFCIVLLMYSIFSVKFNKFSWVVLVAAVFAVVALVVNMPAAGLVLLLSIILSSVESIRIAIKAVRQKKPGAWIIATGFILFISTIVLVVVFYVIMAAMHGGSATITSKSYGLVVVILLWAFSIPTSMSVYLASDFARTNKALALQLIHVKQLADQNIEKEKEKQQIIEGQKRELELKVKEATVEISRQKDELEEKNKEITDSINYARRIQTSILPEPELMERALGEHLVVYKPKDVVSGDFYWCHVMGDKVIFAVADCTGHGVPGAFMSMIGNSILNEIVLGRQITEANAILDEMRNTLITTLQQSSEHITTRDGMDIALCVWNKHDNILEYAGANNSLYLVSRNIAVDGSVKESEKVKLGNTHLLEILADKQPIGYQEGKMDTPFTKNIIPLHKGDYIFIASDGYTDQFGGDKNKKFTSKRFRELLSTFVDKPIAVQQQILSHTIDEWRNLESQTDDICVLGIKVG